MTPNPYNLPPLPPLEDVLKSVRKTDATNSKPEKSTSLLQLINELKDNLSEEERKQLTDYIRGAKIPTIPLEVEYECPILKNATNNGKIKVFITKTHNGPGCGWNQVVCPYFNGLYFCNKISANCSYANIF